MATKREQLKNIVNDDMKNRVLPRDIENPEDTEEKQPVNDPMAIFSIRLPQSQKDSLQAHFKNDLGLDLSPGIRMLITQYMKEHRL